jgi:50S ribosomal protein L16 3-hydroxylase
VKRGGWELNLDKETFLAKYWQYKPLLIRNAISGFEPPVSSDTLAGLALEEDVESRLIEQQGNNWQQLDGPFNESDFLRDHPWTLLVQAVDHYIPEVAELHRLIDFIPQWRTDDIMVSYAVDGGSVGPHYDNYDVFLLQGEGHRLWKLGQHCNDTSELIPHDDLRILSAFEPSEEYLLGPGDMLYVPPGVAHWGIAQGECTTFSIGFRAPRISDMVSRWADQLLQQLPPEQFYCDPGRSPVARPGELQPRDLDQAMTQLRNALDIAVDTQWFGELVTEPRYPIDPDDDEVAHAQALLKGRARSVYLSPAAKVAWQQDGAGITVFANGECLNCAASVLTSLLILCSREPLIGVSLDKATADADTARMLDCLAQSGCIHVE